MLDRKYGGSLRGLLKSTLDDAQLMFPDPQKKLRFIAALESHGINEEAREAIQGNSLSEFVLARESELRHHENSFLKKFDLSIGESVDSSDVEVDVDDD